MTKLPLLFLSMILLNCGVQHHASGEVNTSGTQTIIVDVTIRMDISGCLDLPAEDRLECVKTIANSLEEIAGVAEVLLCVRDLEESPISESANPPESCRRIANDEGE